MNTLDESIKILKDNHNYFSNVCLNAMKQYSRDDQKKIAIQLYMKLVGQMDRAYQLVDKYKF